MDKMSRRNFLKGVAALGVFAAAAYFGLADCSPEKAPGGGDRLEKKDRVKTTVRAGYLPITDHLTVIAASLVQFTHVDFKPVKFSSWPELAEALRVGAIDAAFALTPIGLELRQSGVPIKAVLLGHRNGSVITVRVNDSIESVRDLKGKRIAIPSRFSTHNILIRKVLADNGVDASEVQLLELAPPEMVQTLASGQVDAFIVAEPFGVQAEIQKAGRVLMLSKEIWPDHICCVLNVREELLERDSEALQELIKGLVEAGVYIEGNPEGAAALSRSYLGQDPQVIERVLTVPADRVTFHDLIPELADFAATQRYMKDFQIADNKVNLEEYVEASLARKAYATLKGGAKK